MIERLSVLGHYASARRRMTRFRDRAALQRWQERQVRRQLARIVQRSPYFCEVADSHGIASWRSWPETDKSVMMDRFDTWNTVGIRESDAWALAERAEVTRDFSRTLGGVAVGFSSGTSGSRGLFLASPAERSAWAGALLARVLRGTLLRRHRAALFLRSDSPLYHAVGSRRFRFEFFDLAEPLQMHWKRLRALRPTVLAAPPAILVRLAAAAESADLLAPPAILLSVADVLDAADRDRIEAGFRQPVGQIYQATEGFLAATCPFGRLHWNEDVLVVQKVWLDPAQTRYMPVLTDFRRITQPIVRYRLNDVIVAGDDTPCPCRSVFETLEAIEGRCDDTLTLPSAAGGGEVSVFASAVRRSVVRGLPTGVEYVVRQTAPDRWYLSLSRDVPLDPVEQAVEEMARRLGAVPPTLHPAPWSAPSPDAKLRRVRNEIPPRAK